MGLAIDGNVVHGIAKGGQAFLAIQANEDGSITYNGQKYIDLANASFNATKIDEDNRYVADDNPNILNFTLSNFKNFSEYIFYQIEFESVASQERTLSSPFLIKPNVQMSVKADYLTINVFADNSGTSLSFHTKGFFPRGNYRSNLYGYK